MSSKPKDKGPPIPPSDEVERGVQNVINLTMFIWRARTDNDAVGYYRHLHNLELEVGKLGSHRK